MEPLLCVVAIALLALGLLVLAHRHQRLKRVVRDQRHRLLGLEEEAAAQASREQQDYVAGLEAHPRWIADRVHARALAEAYPDAGWLCPYGLDQWIEAHFSRCARTAYRGHIVEIGAGDGTTPSATRALRSRGWETVLVEARDDAVASLRAREPNATVLHATVASHAAAEGTVALHGVTVDDVPSASRWAFVGSTTRMMRHVNRLGARTERTDVPAHDLAALMATLHAARPADVLILDVPEGSDDMMRVLATLTSCPPLVVQAQRLPPESLEADLSSPATPAWQHAASRGPYVIWLRTPST